MPLRNHFRPPVSKHSSWEGFHGYWPAAMVQKLSESLPKGYVAEPRVHLGSFFEIDVNTYETDALQAVSAATESIGGVAMATYAPPEPSLAIDTDIPEQYEYEVLVYDVERERTLVAAVEIVSPANKDRPESRQMFVAKCAGLLQKGVCVSIVDLVTNRRSNLYADLLALFGLTDPTLPVDTSIYAVTCRMRRLVRKARLENMVACVRHRKFATVAANLAQRKQRGVARFGGVL